MASKTDTAESPTNHPVLVRRTVHANGASQCALRVFCSQQGRSVPLEECRSCRDCVGAVRGTDGVEQAVLCPPDPTATAGSALCRGVIAVEPDVSLDRVVESLAGGHAMAVAVTDADGKIAGVIHESQVLSELLARGATHRHEGERALVEARLSLQRAIETMSSACVVDATTPLRKAVDTMARSHARFVIVVDPGGAPLGMLRDVDGLHALFGKRDDH